MTWVGVGEGWDEVVEVAEEEEVGSGVTAGGGLAVPPASPSTYLQLNRDISRITNSIRGAYPRSMLLLRIGLHISELLPNQGRGRSVLSGPGSSHCGQ